MIPFTLFLSQKSRFADQSHCSHLGIFFHFIEVMKYVVAKSLEIMTTHAKMVAIESYYVSPRYKIFKEVCNTSLKSNQLKRRKYDKNLDKPCKKCLPYFFFSLITGFLKSYQMFRWNNCKCLKSQI